MVPQSGVDISIVILFDGESGSRGDITGVPLDRYGIEGWCEQPAVLPVIQGEISNGEIGLHLAQELIDGSILPLVGLEVIVESLQEVFLGNQEH